MDCCYIKQVYETIVTRDLVQKIFSAGYFGFTAIERISYGQYQQSDISQ